MQKSIYHILNGDALKKMFPNLPGEQIVMRECLVEGSVGGDTLEEIFQTRANFFEENYQINHTSYMQKSASEINKVVSIDNKADVFLWFENDLFCQVNLWFVVNILNQISQDSQHLYLVSPIPDSWNGFGALNKKELRESYINKKNLSNVDQANIASLWVAYQANDLNSLRNFAKKLMNKIDHIQQVVEAHIERFPNDNQPGRPQRSLMEIMKKLDHPTFPNVFREFSKEEGIYGFGDAQVKRLLEDLDLDLS